MARLPVPGGDQGEWGDILNDFLGVSLSGSGHIKPSAITNAGGQLTASKGQANGYAGLNSSGIVPEAQLPARLAGVGDYVGVSGGFAIADNDSLAIEWAGTTATRGTSLAWDDTTPDRVNIAVDGVYAVTVMVQWGDHIAANPGQRTVNIYANCGFYVADQRECAGNGFETYQSVNYTVFMQAGGSFRSYVHQQGEAELNPYAMMLVTRVA